MAWVKRLVAQMRGNVGDIWDEQACDRSFEENQCF
jgi:hypothetical protein